MQGLYCLRAKSFAGQNLGLGLDVVFEIHHLRIIALWAIEGQDAGIFSVDLDTSGSLIYRLHAEGGNRDDCYNCKGKGDDQPLMLPENHQVIEQVRLAWHQV